MSQFKILLLFIFSSLTLSAQVNTSNIEIVRDKWGVPHIYAKTDREVAYGLAWSHAEDDFSTIQKTFLPAKGMLGRLDGCLLYTSPSPRDLSTSRMPSSA